VVVSTTVLLAKGDALWNPKMAKVLRSSSLHVKLTADEHAAVSAAGLRRGLGICSYARMAVVAAAGLQPSPPPRRKATADEVALARWTAQLAVIGNLLNQLARAHNAGFDVDGVDVAAVREELAKLREAVLSAKVTEAEL
jgi:hypothetical protein